MEWLFHVGLQNYHCCHRGWPLEFRWGNVNPCKDPRGSSAAILEVPMLPQQDSAGASHIVKIHHSGPAESKPANPLASYVEAGVDTGPSWGHPLPYITGLRWPEQQLRIGDKKPLTKQKSKNKTFRWLSLAGKKAFLEQPYVPGTPPYTLQPYPVSGTIPLLHLQQHSSWGWSLPTPQFLHAALHGPLKAHVVAASSELIQAGLSSDLHSY